MDIVTKTQALKSTVPSKKSNLNYFFLVQSVQSIDF